jgi:5-methylcytosine-specific restriction endonuclease McrA
MLKKVKRIKLGKQVYGRLMKKVLERDSWRCRKCGSLKDLQVHHQTKRSQQGDDALRNLVTLCAYCHMAEHGQLSYLGRCIGATRMANDDKRDQSKAGLTV